METAESNGEAGGGGALLTEDALAEVREPGFGVAGPGERAAESRHSTCRAEVWDRPRCRHFKIQSWVCFRGGGFPNPMETLRLGPHPLTVLLLTRRCSPRISAARGPSWRSGSDDASCGRMGRLCCITAQMRCPVQTVCCACSRNSDWRSGWAATPPSCVPTLPQNSM
jgi:hypothetical protein